MPCSIKHIYTPFSPRKEMVTSRNESRSRSRLRVRKLEHWINKLCLQMELEEHNSTGQLSWLQPQHAVNGMVLSLPAIFMSADFCFFVNLSSIRYLINMWYGCRPKTSEELSKISTAGTWFLPWSISGNMYLITLLTSSLRICYQICTKANLYSFIY